MKAASMVDIHRYRGRFFEVLQETGRSQTAVMTIEPGRDGGPEEGNTSRFVEALRPGVG